MLRTVWRPTCRCRPSFYAKKHRWHIPRHILACMAYRLHSCRLEHVISPRDCHATARSREQFGHDLSRLPSGCATCPVSGRLSCNCCTRLALQSCLLQSVVHFCRIKSCRQMQTVSLFRCARIRRDHVVKSRHQGLNAGGLRHRPVQRLSNIMIIVITVIRVRIATQ